MFFVFAGSAPLCGASLWITQLMSATEWRAPSYEAGLEARGPARHYAAKNSFHFSV
ncbi:hypothetical protein SAMN02990966_01566 [Rhodospirillales bacterium URHD0017]|nr:hypothetical protein SAMN02990966_01566 [Rhodospirillales bacterium URHD0017]